MDASERVTSHGPLDELIRKSRLPAGFALAGLVALVGLLAAGHRIIAETTHPLPSLGMLATVLIATVLSTAARRLAGRATMTTSTGSAVPWLAQPTVPAAIAWLGLVVLAAALVSSTQSNLSLVLAWLLVAVDGLATFSPRGRGGLVAGVQAIRRRLQSGFARRGHVGLLLASAGDDEDPAAWPDGLQTRIACWRDPEGQSIWSGLIRIDLPRGERVGSAHIGFCPPLPDRPEVECHQVSGPPVRLKVGVALAHGLRIDVKLSQPLGQDSAVLVEFSAQCAAAARPSDEEGWQTVRAPAA
jgi:hypothetical protein